MQDRFNRSGTFDGAATTGFSVTPHDTNTLTELTRALYVGTGGIVVATLASGTDVTLKNVQDGALLPLRVQKVKATGTTAGDIVGLV